MKLKKYNDSRFVFVANGLKDGDHLELLNIHLFFLLTLYYNKVEPWKNVGLAKFEHNRYEFFEIRYEI